MNASNHRVETHAALSRTLDGLSDRELGDRLDQAEALHTGIGGRSALLILDGKQIFVKKVPLCELERRPENHLSTANLFELPMFFQYRVGSPGFGAWREVNSHLLSTDWVLSGACENFPLLYHWRVLPRTRQEPGNTRQAADREEMIQYWGNSRAVRKRYEALDQATDDVVLFLEYLPANLHQWLGRQITQGPGSAQAAVELIERDLWATNAFMNAEGLIHFDAHFRNILTDGTRLYFSDFGLALASRFELSHEEIQFLARHQRFDRSNAALSLVQSLIMAYQPQPPWRERLQEFLNGKNPDIPPAIAEIIRRHAPVAVILSDFFQQLQKDKHTPYPAEQLLALLA